MIIWLTAAAGLGILAAAIAYAKGRPFLLWGLGGTVFGIVVVPYLLLAKDRRDERGWKPERFGLPSRGGNCPHCGARADAEAVVCRVCRKSLINYSAAETHATGGSEAGQRERAQPREQRAAAAAAKPAVRKTEKAPHDPMFRRLDEAFARITVEMQRSTTERRGEGTGAEPTWHGEAEAEAEVEVEVEVEAEAEARRLADAERRAEADRHAEAERQADIRWRAAERQAEARRQADADRQVEADRQAEARRQAAERQAEARRQAEAERQADAELKAEVRRLAAERHAEAKRQAEAERHSGEGRLAEARPSPVVDEMSSDLNAAPTQDEGDDGREEPHFGSADSKEDGAGHEDGWGSPEDERLHMEPRMGRGDPRLAGAWREGRPGFPSLNQVRQRKPWGRRASLALVGVLAAMAVLLAPYTGPWLSRLSPPAALNLAEFQDVPTAPAGNPATDWETASGASGSAAGSDDSAKTPAGLASKGDRPTDGADKQPGKETASAALTPPKAPPPPAAAARPAPSAPEKRAVVSDPSRGGRNVERPAPRREPVEAPLAEDFATAVRKALSEHRGQSPVLGTLEASGITAAGEIVTLVQQRLRERGYDPGSIDGRAGPRTRAAIRKFQRDNNQEEDGDVSVALLQSLGILGQQIHAFGGEVTPTRSP